MLLIHFLKMHKQLGAYNFLINYRMLNHYKIKWCIFCCPMFWTLYSLLKHTFSWRLKRHISFSISGSGLPLPNVFCGCSLHLSLILFRFSNIFSLLSTDKKTPLKDLHKIYRKENENAYEQKSYCSGNKNPGHTFRNISFLVFINNL